MPADNKPVTIHCEAGSTSVRVVFEPRSKCQDFVARYQDYGIPYEIDSPFCCIKTSSLLSANPDQLRTGRSESNFAPLWRVLADQLKIFSLMEMTPVHKSSALKIEETGLENLCSNLPPMEVDKRLPLLHLICVFLVSPEVLQRIAAFSCTMQHLAPGKILHVRRGAM